MNPLVLGYALGVLIGLIAGLILAAHWGGGGD
jgi:hypothetical protein